MIFMRINKLNNNKYEILFLENIKSMYSNYRIIFIMY